MIGGYVFNEISPSAPGTAASSALVTGSSVLGIASPMDDWEAVDIAADLQGATGGTLNVYLQLSPDAGNNWYDIVHWTALAAAAPLAFYQSPLSLATNTAAPVAVGRNLAPSLGPGATAAVVNGAFSDRLRLVMVAGSGTTAGAPVVVRIAPQRVRVTT